jgi:hypothetical protein
MVIGQSTPCDLHIPHKDWSDNVHERENYLALERWVYRFRTGCPGEETVVMIGQSTPCDLHIPHKDWSGDSRERENYLEMERWAYYFRMNCCAGGMGGGGLPESPPILMSETTSTDFCISVFGMAPAALEDNVRFNRVPTVLAPGITFDQPLGPGGTVEPYSYGSTYYADAVHYSVPPATNVRVHVKFSFSETTIGSPYDVEPVTRGLHLRIRTGTTDIDNVYQNFAGTRYGPVVGQIDGGPYDIATPFVIHVYCLWNTVNSAVPGTHNQNVYHGSDGIVVTGVIT